MLYLVFMLVTLILLAGFLVLTWYETGRGVRVFAPQRARLDRGVEQIELILTHVDLGRFLREETRRLLEIVGHFVAELSLQLVRAIERLLTRLVRHLRMRGAAEPAAPRESVREFVKTLSDFKSGLDPTRPPLPPP